MGRWFGEFHWMISPQNVFLQGHDTGIEAVSSAAASEWGNMQRKRRLVNLFNREAQLKK